MHEDLCTKTTILRVAWNPIQLSDSMARSSELLPEFRTSVEKDDSE